MVDLKSIGNKYPFIYQVGKNLYCIGKGVFKIYGSTLGVEYFEQYRKIVSKIGSQNLRLQKIQKEDGEQLEYTWNKVRVYSCVDSTEENFREALENLKNFLNNITDEQKEELIMQVEDDNNSFMYINKKRESSMSE